jgi:hypothetical protein
MAIVRSFTLKELETVRVIKTAWCAEKWGGGAQAGVVVEVVKGVKYAPKPPGMYENGRKQAVCHTY